MSRAGRVHETSSDCRPDALCRNSSLSVNQLAIDVTIGVPANHDGGAAVTGHCPGENEQEGPLFMFVCAVFIK